MRSKQVEAMFPGLKIVKTDNANARAIGKLPKWTVRLDSAERHAFMRFDTLEEVVEFYSRRLKPVQA